MLNTVRREEWRQKKKVIQEWPGQRSKIDELKNEIEKLHDIIDKQQVSNEKDKKNMEILS